VLEPQLGRISEVGVRVDQCFMRFALKIVMQNDKDFVDVIQLYHLPQLVVILVHSFHSSQFPAINISDVKLMIFWCI
jgi:hypothetical protein